jgi:hypothetical protein
VYNCICVSHNMQNVFEGVLEIKWIIGQLLFYVVDILYLIFFLRTLWWKGKKKIYIVVDTHRCDLFHIQILYLSIFVIASIYWENIIHLTIYKKKGEKINIFDSKFILLALYVMEIMLRSQCAHFCNTSIKVICIPSFIVYRIL